MVQTLLMLEVLFTQDSKVEDLFLHSTNIYRFFLGLKNPMMMMMMMTETLDLARTQVGNPVLHLPL